MVNYFFEYDISLTEPCTLIFTIQQNFKSMNDCNH